MEGLQPVKVKFRLILELSGSWGQSVQLVRLYQHQKETHRPKLAVDWS